MDRDKQIGAFEDEIEKVIARFRHEYDMNYASLIGSLTLKAHELAKEALEVPEEEGT